MVKVTHDRILAKKLISENKAGRFVLLGDDAIDDQEEFSIKSNLKVSLKRKRKV